MNKDVCPVCGKEVNTSLLDGEIVLETHFPNRGTEGYCTGSEMPVSQTFQE